MDKDFFEKLKKVRSAVQIGSIACMDALKKNNCDVEKTIKWLRTQGIAKNINAFRESKEANEGITKCLCDEEKAVIIEVNCETDFVAKNKLFCDLVNNFLEECLKNNEITNFEQALQKFAVLSLLPKTMLKEKIVLRRFKKIFKKQNECFGYYNHMERIATIVILQEKNDQLAKDMAVHIASNDVRYMNFEDIDKKIIDEEKEIIYKSIMNDEKTSKKPQEIINKIIDSRINKEIGQFVLNNQLFVYDESKKVSDILIKNNNKIVCFVKYVLGEKIV